MEVSEACKDPRKPLMVVFYDTVIVSIQQNLTANGVISDSICATDDIETILGRFAL